MPRPPEEPFPEVDEPPAAAIPASGAEVDNVEVVGLDTAPAIGSEVVVVEDAFAGATAIGVLVVAVLLVESLLWSVVPSIEVVVGKVVDEDDVVGASTTAVPSGDDFLISLCGLRTVVLPSLVVDRPVALVRVSVDLETFSWPSTTSCSANADVASGSEQIRAERAVKATGRKGRRIPR